MGLAKKHFRFQVGDQVAFLYGPRMVRGEIIENRGPFGVYGDQVYLVRTTLDSEGPVAVEVQEQDLKPATAADENARAPWFSESLSCHVHSPAELKYVEGQGHAGPYP